MFRTLIALAVLLSMTVVAIAAPRDKQAKAVSTPEHSIIPVRPEAQVMLYDKPLLAIRANILSFSPEDRAKAISTRLAKLVKDPLFSVNSVKITESESTSDIVADDMILMSITESDALAEGKTRQGLAVEFAAKIRTAVEARNKEYSMHSIMLGSVYSLLATLTLLTVLAVFKHYLPRIIIKIQSWRGTYIRSIRIQSIEILNEERIVAVLTSLIQGARTVFLLGLLYFYIPLVLSFFPWTHGMATKLFDYLLAPVEKAGLAFISYLPNVFFLLVIAVITYYAIKLISFIFSEIGKQTISIPGFYPEWAEPTFKIVRFLMFAFAAVVAFPYLPGSDSPAFKGVSVFLGVLFSLGSSSAVANIVAGVILTYMRAFKLGDRVKIAETVGDVVEKTLLITRIRTIKNVDITVPNAMVLGSHITNFSSSSFEYGLILHTTVTIGYDTPWRQVHELLISAARASGNILELPAPFVLQTSLDDFFVSYELNAYTDKPSIMARTYSEIHQNIQEKFNQAGVEIMSPHYSSLRDGNMTTIPESFRPEAYRRPSFKVEESDSDD